MSKISTPRRKTKIVATLGPASSSKEIIAELITYGMDVVRLNFSHGTHEEHTSILKNVREAADKQNRHVAILQDLCGPKMRINDVEGGEITLLEDGKVTLQKSSNLLGTTGTIYLDAFDPAGVMRPGEKVLLSDGRVELRSEEVKGNQVVCKIVAGGAVRSRSGIAVPDTEFKVSCLTDKDRKDVQWAVANEVDYIALSFVGSAKDVLELNLLIESLGAKIPVIAKIERASSLDDLGAIVEAADAVMVARGDLGLELPLERVPSAQRLIIETANFNGRPVITATQMLMSMVKEVRPTRAEVSDVSTAVRDGTDAVMLSDETAIGLHPVESVRMLDRIIIEAEKESHYERYKPKLKGSDREKVADAVCYAACNAADKVSASAILACTQSGYTARLISKYRPQQLLFGATSELKSLRRMALYWGVEPVFIEVEEDSVTEEEVLKAMLSVKEGYGIKPGSRVVITAGLRTKKSGSTNVMEIREIPRTN